MRSVVIHKVKFKSKYDYYASRDQKIIIKMKDKKEGIRKMMDVEDVVLKFKQTLQSPSYSFLRENEHLGDKIMILTLGGSYAYGVNVETSDMDVRGCAANSKRELLTNENFEQLNDKGTDTTIYSFNKLVSLLTNANPNVIEMLGNRPEFYFYVSPLGRELLNHRSLFLSKRAIVSFGGYATAQLRRLENMTVKDMEQQRREEHILNTINNAMFSLKERYFPLSDEDEIELFIDDAVNPEFEKEIFIKAHLQHYPLRDYVGLWNELREIVRSYNKIGKRNEYAVEHGKIGKHMMHLIRLYFMCLDILEKREIITYRENEHDLLMSLRNGEWLSEDGTPRKELYDMVTVLEERVKKAGEKSKLPDKPDYKKINDFVMSVNERVVKGEI